MGAKGIGLHDFGRILDEMLEPHPAQESAEAAVSPAATPPHQLRSKRPPRVTLASARKQAERAGFAVLAAEFYPDGRLRRLEFVAPNQVPVEIDAPDKLRRLI